MDTEAIDKIREKHRLKQEVVKAKREEHKQAVESGEKKLLLETTPTGMLYVKFEGGGALPEVLQGRFTSVERIRQICMAKYGRDLLRT